MSSTVSQPSFTVVQLPQSPIFACRVIMTPHVAGVTELSYRTMASVVAAEVRRHMNGLPPTIQLNSISKTVPDAL